MVKLLWIALLLSLACRLFLGVWPWRLLAKSSPSQGSNPADGERFRARALLGVGKSASREEIIEAHRRLVAMVHPDRGGTSEQVHEANAARDLLLGELAAGITEQS